MPIQFYSFLIRLTMISVNLFSEEKHTAMTTSAHVLIAAGFMRSPSDDL